jgi:starch synthase
MKNNLKFLFVASEAVPFAKVGGLADVVGALAQSIKKLLPESDVRIVIPCYLTVKNYLNEHLLKPTLLSNFEIKIGTRAVNGEIYELNYKNVVYYFISQPEYFDREGIYVDVETKNDYSDSLERFVFFSRAVLEGLRIISYQPDIIQVNDWQTSLIPVYLKTEQKVNNFYRGIKSVLLIHNLSYQGIFSIDQYYITGLDWKHFNKEELEFYGYLNLLKGGIVFSDCIITVSETYAKEIQTVEYGNGLEEIIKKKADEGKVFGVVNGVDYEEWDPSIDIYLKEKFGINYDFDTIERKKIIKEKFLREYGIANPDVSKPLISIISRLVDQKGFDILFRVIDDIMKLDIYFVVLGTGKREYELKFNELKQIYPENLLAFIEFNIPLSHYIEAAADIFILPSRFEPCGLNQLYSLRYGTIPVARKTGGLADTLKDGKNSFLFERYSPEEFFHTLSKAISVYRNEPEKWHRMIEEGMKERWDWARSAKKYIEIYNKLLVK